MNQDKIVIKGAREHNLKNINLEIPKNKLVETPKIANNINFLDPNLDLNKVPKVLPKTTSIAYMGKTILY